MKKKNLKNLSLNKKSVSSLAYENTKGGAFSVNTPICNTQEPEFCNWTYNNWCYNTGDLWCTAPK